MSKEVKKHLAKIDFVKGGIKTSYRIYYMQEKDNKDLFTAFIPAYNLHFTASSIESAREMGEIYIGAFYEFWLKHDKGLTSLALELHSLGFRAPTNHNMVIGKMIGKKRIVPNVKFRSYKDIPFEMKNTNLKSEEVSVNMHA